MAKKKVLIVDDEKDFTALVKMILEDTGRYEVRMENKGDLGLAAAKLYKPDIVLLDLIMPDKEGSYVAEEIKKDVAIKDTPILFLTAAITIEEENSQNGIIGGHPFVAKPVSVEDLVQAVDKYTKK